MSTPISTINAPDTTVVTRALGVVGGGGNYYNSRRRLVASMSSRRRHFKLLEQQELQAEEDECVAEVDRQFDAAMKYTTRRARSTFNDPKWVERQELKREDAKKAALVKCRLARDTEQDPSTLWESMSVREKFVTRNESVAELRRDYFKPSCGSDNRYASLPSGGIVYLENNSTAGTCSANVENNPFVDFDFRCSYGVCVGRDGTRRRSANEICCASSDTAPQNLLLTPRMPW